MIDLGGLPKLPNGWTWARVGDVVQVITGNTPSKKDPENYGNHIPFVKPPELNNSSITRAWDNLSENGAKLARLLPPKSVLVSCIGILGKVGINKVPVAFNQQINAVIFPEGIVPGFGFYYFQRVEIKRMLNKIASATTIPIVNKSKFETLPIALAPLPEQHRIVAKIEELFTRLDAGVELLKKVRAQLEKYRQAALKAAVEGKLTEQWRKDHPDVEPVDKLLQRILAERRTKWEEAGRPKMRAKGKEPEDGTWKRKYQEPIKPEVDGLPDIPDQWLWVSLDQLSDATRAITYGVIKLGDHIEDGVPTLRSSNVRHLWLQMDRIKKISPELSNEYSRTILEGGEVLVTIRGTLGGVVSVPYTCTGYNISREVAMIAPSSKTSPMCLAMLIGSKPIQNWLTRKTKGIAYTGINLETLKATPVPLMSPEEQLEIVKILEHQLSIIEDAELKIDMNLKRAENLRQSVLKKAFSGELVPQDPTDEPAENLLERIKWEKAKMEAGKTGKKRIKRKDDPAQMRLI